MQLKFGLPKQLDAANHLQKELTSTNYPRRGVPIMGRRRGVAPLMSMSL